MATTYPLANSTFTLTINGASFTQYVLSRTLSIHHISGGQADTCTFGLKTPETWRVSAAVPTIAKPSVGAEVIVSLGAVGSTLTQEFGGFITDVNEATISPGRVRWDITCTDYSSLLQRALANKTYRDMLASDIIADLCRTYAPTIDTSLLTPTQKVINVISFTFMYLTECISALATLEGQLGTSYYWSISPTKQLRFGPTGTYTSPNSITDTSLNFLHLQIHPQIQQVRNRVFVQGGAALSHAMYDYRDQATSTTNYWNIPYPNVIMNLASGLAYPTDAMTVNGLGIPVQLEGIGQVNGATVDDAAWQGGAFLGYGGDTSFIRLALNTPIPNPGDHILFKFQYPVPIGVVRESLDSMATVALLVGEDYAFVVSGDGPQYWWRLNDQNVAYSAKAAVLGVAPKVVSGPYYVATYSGGITAGVAGPITAEPTIDSVDFGGANGRVACASGVCISTKAYTLEAWVQADPLRGNSNVGLVGQYDSTGGNGAALFLDATGQYNLVHNSTTMTPSPSTTPVGAAYDHVVATFSGGCAALYVNTRLIANAGAFPTPVRTAFGVEIGAYNNQTGAHFLRGRMADVAIYDYAISGSVIAEHYAAGKWGGVRESVVSDSSLTSFDEARREGDGQLARYSSVTTDIKFESEVSGWKVGDTVPITVTAANTGHAYTGNATIQEVQLEWLGAQWVHYAVSCSEVLFNWFDQQIALAQAQPDQLLGAIQNQISAYTCTALIVPGAAVGTKLVTLPYVVGPDWGAQPANVGKVNMAQIPTANGGN